MVVSRKALKAINDIKTDNGNFFHKPNLIRKGKEPSQMERPLNLSQKIHAIAFLYFLS